MVVAATFTTWLQVIGTLIAALAALASWAAVVQSRRLIDDSRLPALHIEVSRLSGAGAVDGTAAVAILNAGALATRVGFILVTPLGFAQASLPGGFLRPEESASFGTDMQIGEESRRWSTPGVRTAANSSGTITASADG